MVNFQALTDNWDTESSVSILKRNDWNLEKAANEYMSGPLGPPTSETLPSFMLPSAPAPRSQDPLHPPDQSPGIWARLKSVFNEMWSDPRAANSKAAQDFIQKLVSHCPRVLGLFSAHALKDVIHEAHRARKVLLIYVASQAVPISYTLEVLCNDRSLGLVAAHYLAWAVERESPEGRTAERLLKAGRLPCFALVSVDNPARPVVLSKAEGLLSAGQLAEFLSAQFTPLRSSNPRQQELDNERQLRTLQDLELKAAEKMLEERKKAEETQKLEAKKQLELRDANKKAKIQAVGEEPDGPDVVLVSFRMQNGCKVERRFDRRRSVQVLYDFLETQDVSGVEVLFGFPAVILNDKNVSLEEAGLYPRALVIVRKVEDN